MFGTMLDFTSLARPIFFNRLKTVSRYINYGDSVQREQLAKLLRIATFTEIGKKYEFSETLSYEQFKERVPLQSYEDIRPDIMRMIKGEKNVLWPGIVTNFAQSSGTSDGKSKYIPITHDSFNECHYQGGFDVIAHYLNMNSESRIFSGKSFILGGSFANELNLGKGVKVGDLSANLISNINPIANLIRVPSKKIALQEDWEKKLPLLVEEGLKHNITNISGVPSWWLTVLKEMMKAAGTNNIHDIWPNLEIFFHGGISFAPYREQYKAICDNSKMHFLDTYNASEGFFAVQSSWNTTAMLLLLDVGIFYEFIPIEDVDSDNPRTLPIWEVEQGKTYALVISANNGLWRYKIGDTVRIEQTKPLKIHVAGRTKSYINAFGEELMVYNAEEAMEKTCKELNASIANYTAAPVYADGNQHGHHQWLIEFNKEPEDISQFANRLDLHLQEINSDYEAKRHKDIFLDRLEVTIASKGLFDAWLALSGKLGGQRKIPRLSNDRHIISEMLKLNINNL